MSKAYKEHNTMYCHKPLAMLVVFVLATLPLPSSHLTVAGSSFSCLNGIFDLKPYQDHTPGDWRSYSTLIGDFNGDKHDDILWIDFSRTYVGLSKGDGTFDLKPYQDHMLTDLMPYTILLGDFNGDRKTDILWNDTQTNSRNRIYVGLSKGDGTFDLKPYQDFTPGDWTPYATLVGDFNGDGKTDILWNDTTTNGFSRIYVGLSKGDGTFDLRPYQDRTSGNWTSYVRVPGDYNGDGRTDMLWNDTQTNGFNRIYVGLSKGDGTFDLKPYQDLTPGDWTSYARYEGDYNGDGKTDILWNDTQTNGFNRIYVGLSKGDGTFDLKPYQDHTPGDWRFFGTLIGDYNGDGRADILWNSTETNNSNRIYVGLSKGDGTFDLTPPQDHMRADWTPYRKYVGDFNADGKTDILWNDTATNGFNRIYVGLIPPCLVYLPLILRS